MTSAKEIKILMLKEQYKERMNNLEKSMDKINPNIEGYDLWLGSHMAYEKVVQDLEMILKDD